METEHAETAIEKFTSYVKTMLGIPQDRHSHVDAKPDYGEIAPALHFDDGAPELTSKDAMRLEPGAYTTKTVGELSAKSARRGDVQEM